MAGPTLYMSPITLIVQYLTNLGVMAQGGILTIYTAGTTTPAITYTDSTGTQPNPNPMTLNQAGRPAAASGAPTAFWTLPGVVLKLSVVDAQGNQLVGPLDNIAAIGDLTNNSLQTLLASPASSNISGFGPVAGADLVANAVKSYDIFADVRGANAPTPSAGQTLNIEVQGAIAIGDGLGGIFYWSSTSSAADNGATVLKPNATTGAGRWLRMAIPWSQLGSGLYVPQYLVRTSDNSITSNATPANDPVLQIALAASAFYLVEAFLLFQGVGGTGQGYKCAMNYSGTFANTALQAEWAVSTNGATPGFVAAQFNGSVVNSVSVSSTNGDTANFRGTTATGLTPGTLAVQVAQSSSSVNATVLKAGSVLRVTRLG